MSNRRIFPFTWKGDTRRALAGLLFACVGALPALAQPVPIAEKQTPEQRLQVQRQAEELNAEGVRKSQQGRHVEAQGLFRKALDIRYRLYPLQTYPDGHPDLADTLNNLGVVLRARAEMEMAEAFYRGALAMRRRLFLAERYPQGHPDLAASLNNLGVLLNDEGDPAEAEKLHREALAMRRRLYPLAQHPDGHLELVRSLNNLGLALHAKGEPSQAEACYREALAMARRVLGPVYYPDGHFLLANTLNNLGGVLKQQGEYAAAEPFWGEALAMRQRLFPVEQFPQGHPDVADSLNNLGMLLAARQQHGKAEELVRQALAMRRKLYPAALYPDGHPALARSLHNLGGLCELRDDLVGAAALYREALALQRKLFGGERYPQGHPDLASTLENLGVISLAQHPDESETFLRDALAVQRKLFPADRYPLGHPQLARALHNLGTVLLVRDKAAEAETCYREGLTMSQRLFGLFAGEASQARVLNFLAETPDLRTGLLAATARPGADAAATCDLLWGSRSAMARLLQGRQRALARTADPATRRLAEQLQEARHRLAALLLAPTAGLKHAERLQELGEAKEELEKQLAARLPPRPPPKVDAMGADDLCKLLPEGAAVVDCYRYCRITKSGDAGAWRYAAFVLESGREVRRVELGEETTIAEAVQRWRQALGRGQDDRDSAALLRRLVWEPVARELACCVRSVHIVPDGALARLPWAALPGSKPGTVLLEDHALAVLPEAGLLLEHLAPGTRPAPGGTLLAVGGVDYGPLPARKADMAWPALPGTTTERQRVLALARQADLTDAVELSGRDASFERVMGELAKARWAHLATHGFFAGPEFRSLLRIDEGRFATHGREGREKRFAAGARSPLVLSGLVLAGANLRGKDAHPDGSILTAESIAGLTLDRLELVVLSACETGLGEVAGGEGILGLQRAFHLAGTRNAIASLWKVDDDATAALMSLFYHNMWLEKMTPLEALRQAQLTIYRHPDRIGALARERGPDFAKVVHPPAGPTGQSRAPARLWAGFVLSGPGR